MPQPVQIVTANKTCETETQLVTASWQHAVAGNNCLQSKFSCTSLPMKQSWEHDRLDWQTEQVDGSFELLGNYKRDSLWNSRCWSASSMTTLQSTWSSGYFLLLTMHNNRRSCGMSSSHQQGWQQNNCFKDKEKVIANFYLQHCLRALRMFLSPMEKVGRCVERSTDVPTLHHILNFLGFMAVGLDLGPVLSTHSSGTCRWEIGLL